MEFVLEKPYHVKSTSYKIMVSITFGLLYSKTVREFFGLRDTRTDPRVYYVFLNILILAVLLTLILLGERFLWNNWPDEFRNMARLVGSLFLLVASAFSLYGAASEFLRRKIEGAVECVEVFQKH